MSSTVEPQALGQGLLKRKAGTTRQEFNTYWETVHAPLVAPWALKWGIVYYAQVIIALIPSSFRETSIEYVSAEVSALAAASSPRGIASVLVDTFQLMFLTLTLGYKSILQCCGCIDKIERQVPVFSLAKGVPVF